MLGECLPVGNRTRQREEEIMFRKKGRELENRISEAKGS
jgi:hypothetical protein